MEIKLSDTQSGREMEEGGKQSLEWGKLIRVSVDVCFIWNVRCCTGTHTGTHAYTRF